VPSRQRDRCAVAGPLAALTNDEFAVFCRGVMVETGQHLIEQLDEGSEARFWAIEATVEAAKLAQMIESDAPGVDQLVRAAELWSAIENLRRLLDDQPRALDFVRVMDEACGFALEGTSL
jgi:hypothetical protein